MKKSDEIIECPCYQVCEGLSLEMSTWCHYSTAAVPPPGTVRFDPKEAWCPPGVQANVLMLGYMLTKGEGDPERLQMMLAQVRQWAKEIRGESVSYKPAG